LAGAGDFGVDIAGFKSKDGFQGPWDNYQCKRYAQPLRPSDIWVEIGKIIYYSHRKEFIAPDKHYFVCSQGVGTTLEKLLNNTDKLKEQTRSNWEKHRKTEITSTAEIPLEGELLQYFDAFDFRFFLRNRSSNLSTGMLSRRITPCVFVGGFHHDRLAARLTQRRQTRRAATFGIFWMRIAST
jgi:hypothetical protein